MSGITNTQVEACIAAFGEGIGLATHTDLHPDPSTMSANEKHSVLYQHVLNVARMQTWLDPVQQISLEDCDERLLLLENLLCQRIQEVCSVIMALGLVN